MLHQMAPAQFRERYVAWMLTDGRDEWEKVGAIAAAVHNGTSRNLAKGEPIPPDAWAVESDFRVNYTFSDGSKMLDGQLDGQERKRGLSDDEAFEQFREATR